jgi:hypothetical protein
MPSAHEWNDALNAINMETVIKLHTVKPQSALIFDICLNFTTRHHVSARCHQLLLQALVTLPIAATRTHSLPPPLLLLDLHVPPGLYRAQALAAAVAAVAKSAQEGAASAAVLAGHACLWAPRAFALQ